MFSLFKIKVLLAAVGTIKKDLDETHLQDLLTEIVIGALRGTNLHVNLSNYANCPRLWREPVQQGYSSLPIHYDSMVSRHIFCTYFIILTYNQLQSDHNYYLFVVTCYVTIIFQCGLQMSCLNILGMYLLKIKHRLLNCIIKLKK